MVQKLIVLGELPDNLSPLKRRTLSRGFDESESVSEGCMGDFPIPLFDAVFSCTADASNSVSVEKEQNHYFFINFGNSESINL